MIKVDGTFVGPCCTCGSQMWLPQALHDAAKHGRERITFFCPYGHPQVFCKGDSELDVMRRERDRLKQQLAQKDETIAAQHRELLVVDKKLLEAKTQRRKSVKRSAAGTCPCCKRTFRQMAAHMKSQHPEFIASEVH